MYILKTLNSMNDINDKEINNIAKYILLHGTLNFSKSTQNTNCMNTCRGKSKFRVFCILFDVEFNSIILTTRLIIKIRTKKML